MRKIIIVLLLFSVVSCGQKKKNKDTIQIDMELLDILKDNIKE